MLWRRKWAVILPFVAVSLGTFAVSSWLPDRYRSETVILVVPQRVPEDYVRPTVTARIEDRLRTIQQQILTRTRLEQIIRDLKLYPREIARQPMEDVVELMRRRDVRVDIVKGDAFRVTYTYDNPKTAMDVAARLASEFQNESLSDRATQAQSTTHFLESQLISARKRLEAQEAKFADFQRRYSGQLPSEREANLQVLHNLQLQVQSVLESLNRDRDRRLFLERSMAEWRRASTAEGPLRWAELSRRGAPLKIAGFATCLLADRRDSWELVERCIDHALLALVRYDQVRDWEDDLRADRWNAFVATISPFPQTPANRERNRATVLAGLLMGGAAGAEFARIRADAVRAACLATELDCRPLAAHLSDYAERTAAQGVEVEAHYRIAADRATTLIFGTSASRT